MGAGDVEMKDISAAYPNSNISIKKDFDTDVFLTEVVAYFQVLSVMFIEYGQKVKHDIPWLKLFWEEWVVFM